MIPDIFTQSYSITNNLEVERSAFTYTKTVRILCGSPSKYALLSQTVECLVSLYHQESLRPANFVAMSMASFNAPVLVPVAWAEASLPPPLPLIKGTISLIQPLAVNPAAILD